ncbi:Uncharacterized protein dnm_038160 [Desulfonema magnum]|uniref:Uncharacterized protein n=1 Tax=Desulfonema magnum TaxID=45655 RepID=A0A975GNH5_9BACT|nr:Uncharacterized protein dnm_038160 [Desulfonema magnum]
MHDFHQLRFPLIQFPKIVFNDFKNFKKFCTSNIIDICKIRT